MVEILIASHNQNKIKEVKSILDHTEIKLISLKDLNDYDDVIEDGETFLENAKLKAIYFAKKHKMITISDDSGLVVEALDGRPGIYSARYSGLGDIENNLKVLKELEDVDNRKAYFICEIVLCYPNGYHKSYQGFVHGHISNEIRGSNGFGYDTIFYLPEYQQTFGELDSEIKNRISHRSNALKLLKGDLDEIINYK
jgi:XTP/dITP diphosphohydrolase